MKNDPWMAWFIAGIVLGAVMGIVIFKDYYRDDLCQEMFAHAETAADSLVIVQNDDYCLELIER